MVLAAILTAVIGYLLGNVNGAILASRLIAHEDVRDHGSGNAGLTNFIRNYGAQNTLLVFLIDGGKAVLACLIGGWLLGGLGYPMEGKVLGGAAVMVGHIFPAFLGFRGGKGILSGWFIAWAIDWRIGVLLITVFAVAYGLTQYVSLGSVLAGAAFCIAFLIWHNYSVPVVCCGVFMGLLTIFMHRENIVRLIQGKERKTNLFGKGKKE